MEVLSGLIVAPEAFSFLKILQTVRLFLPRWQTLKRTFPFVTYWIISKHRHLFSYPCEGESYLSRRKNDLFSSHDKRKNEKNWCRVTEQCEH